MEFRFDLSSIFTNPIIKINSNLLPANFRGDRRTALETTTKMAEIINTMGECSAKAQGLSKPVTTAQKLRQSDQNLYLLGDPNAGKNGAVLGLLKVGKKTLYVFDNNGDTQTVNAPCVLDFYVHESRQRSGLGKTLFEMMLKEENFLPKKLAIDRPSDKLLGFLKKHYGLHKSIPQMNNFVIYEGFFDDTNNITTNNNQEKTNNRVEITASPNTALFGTQFGSEEYKRNKQQCAAANIQTIQNTPVGRYAAPRPACSMAEVFNTTDSVLQNNQNQNQNNHFNIQQIPPQVQSVNQSQQQTYQNIGTTNGMYQVPQNSQNQMPQLMNNFQSVPQVTQQQFNQMNSQPILQNTPPQCMIQPAIQTQNQLQIQNNSSPIMPQQPIAQINTQSINQVPLNQSAPPELMQQMNFQSMNPMGSQPIPSQGMTQAMPQPIVQSSIQPITQAMPQTMPQSVVQSAPQIMAQAMPQQLGSTYPQQIVQAQQQQQQQQFMQPMNNPSQQVVDQSNISAQNTGINIKNEETSTQRRFKANGLSEDPQKSTYVPSTQLQYVQPAGKPSGLNRNKQNNLSPSVSTSNNCYVRRPMQQQQPNQPVFQQNQVAGTINQNPDQKNTMDLSPKMSSASLKSRRFKADGLSEDPQRVIHTAKTEVSKMQPAGKPSGMYYSNKSSLGVSSSITSMQNRPTSSYQNKMNDIQQSNAMMLTSNTSSAQNINNQYSQIPNDQLQMQNLQMVNASQTSVNPMQGVQMVPSTQMIPQTIIPQVTNSQMMGNQVANPQVFANQATVAQDINNVQAVNNIQVPEGQNINGQAFSAPINNVSQSQMQNVQPINQIVNPQVMNNQMMNPQVINSQAINTQAVAANNQQFVNNQMGDYQMKTNPTDNLSLQMQNPQIINTVNPSEPLQIQNNMNEANKVMNNISAAIIHSTTASAKGELKSDEKENETKKSDIETTAEQHDDNLDINIIEDDGAKNSNNIEKYVVEEEEEHKKKLKTTNGLSNNEQHNIDIIDAASLSLNDDDDDNKQQQQQQNIEISSNNILNVNKPSLQQHSINKMHTGLKNISFNVGMAVSPTNKMEFERDSNKIGGGGSVSGGHSPIHDNTDAQSTVSSVGSGDGYTDQGYFDLKFYHNKLW